MVETICKQRILVSTDLLKTPSRLVEAESEVARLDAEVLETCYYDDDDGNVEDDDDEENL